MVKQVMELGGRSKHGKTRCDKEFEGVEILKWWKIGNGGKLEAMKNFKW